MNRDVQPELLDRLPPDDPRAVRSRRDLRRVNAMMRNHEIMAHALQPAMTRSEPPHVTDLGAGDGSFLFGVAQRLGASAHRFPAAAGTPGRGLRTGPVTATLLDLQTSASVETISAFDALEWKVDSVVADAFDWLESSTTGGVFIANLFLHHFENARLAELLALVSRRATFFVAVEPERAPWPLLCSRLLGLAGCNDVTRHDAPISVRAGFAGSEISELWPDKIHWRITERRAGSFSHLFIAEKTG